MHPFFRYTCASIMRSPVISRRSSMAETCSFGICSQRYHVTSFFALIGRWGGVRLMDDRVEVVIGIEEEVHRLQPARQLGEGESGENDSVASLRTLYRDYAVNAEIESLRRFGIARSHISQLPHSHWSSTGSPKYWRMKRVRHCAD